jgi:hypothetical protein
MGEAEVRRATAPGAASAEPYQVTAPVEFETVWHRMGA